MKIAAGTWVNAAQRHLSKSPQEAKRLIAQGLQVDPGLAGGYFNIGLTLHHQGRISAAIRAYRKALAMASQDEDNDLVRTSALRNLAQDLLLNGEFREGWNLYEQRAQPKHHRLIEQLLGPAWTGIWDPRPMNQLVLVAEQGLGDTVMFSRLALSLQRQLGLPIIVLCQKELVELLGKTTSLNRVVAELSVDELNEPGCRWCSLMSLPHRMNINPTRMERHVPYIRITTEHINQWKAKLQRRRGYKLVGLHWQGNPKHERSLYSHGRSMPFEAIIPMGQLGNIEFVSLQKGFGSEQLRTDRGLEFVQGQATVSASMDFTDTAAVMANCDLVVSADSGIVHLAGAMGLPTWVALAHVPEWRWQLGCERSPWYPSLRLFRQGSPGDWGGVIHNMKQRWISETNG
jgi:hypothetical protein